MTDKKKNNFFHYFFSTGEPIEEEIFELMENKMDLNVQNENGDTPLHLYASNKNINEKISKIILSKKRNDYNLRNNKGETVIFCLFNNPSCNIEILSQEIKNGANINILNFRGISCYQNSQKNNFTHNFFEKKENFYVNDGIFGSIKNSNFDDLMLLIEHNADVSYFDEDRINLPLVFAISQQNISVPILKYLLKNTKGKMNFLVEINCFKIKIIPKSN